MGRLRTTSSRQTTVQHWIRHVHGEPLRQQGVSALSQPSATLGLSGLRHIGRAGVLPVSAQGVRREPQAPASSHDHPRGSAIRPCVSTSTAIHRLLPCRSMRAPLYNPESFVKGVPHGLLARLPRERPGALARRRRRFGALRRHEPPVRAPTEPRLGVLLLITTGRCRG